MTSPLNNSAASVGCAAKTTRSIGPLLGAAGPLLGAALAFALTSMAAPEEAQAENLIKRPGAHNQYSFEIEPQLAVSWAGNAHYYNYNGYGYNTGFGPGVRVSIPFMHNGPITTINNNIGISFGLNTFFYDSPNNDHPIVWTLPVAFQWNFYFTDIISVLGEAGLSTNLVTAQGYSHFYVEPLFQGGGRFQFGMVGVIVRIGYPMASVGANFQF